MTAKEKAKELVDKYKDYAHKPQSYGIYFERDESDWLNNAKQCSLIAVDEIINSQPKLHIEYFQQVKEEINKL